MSLAAAAKRLARNALKRLGLHVQRYSPLTVPEALLKTAIESQQIDLVLDVGANAGQYARSLRELGYEGEIISFEPLPEAWEACARQAARDSRWSMAPRMALGAADGRLEIHVSKNLASSSLLPMGDMHRRLAPQSQYIGRELVDVRRLDALSLEALARASRPLLKMDTQGYEGKVLEGARGILHRIHGVQVEISLAPLYEGSPSFGEMLDLMKGAGFELYAILPEFIDPQSGRMLQIEGLFFREPPSDSQAAARP